jgi:hypothetical protein
MSQLQQVRDVTDPNNIYIGNPELRPRYTNDLSIRFQRFVPEKQAAFMLMANGNYILNDIVNDVANLSGGAKRTTYTNVDGNYSGNLRFMMNSSIKRKGEFTKFSVNSMTMASYSNSNSYIDSELSLTKSLTLSERAGIDYRSQMFDLGVNGNIRYNKMEYSLRSGNNQNTFTYGVGGTTAIYFYNISKSLPFVIESDVTYSANSGFSNDYQQKEVMWNASLSSKPLRMPGGTGTLRLKIYDILQQRSNISNSTVDNVYTESSTNTLTSYFIVHFIYRFSVFKGGANSSDAMGGGRRREGGPPGGPPPGGGGPPRF